MSALNIGDQLTVADLNLPPGRDHHAGAGRPRGPRHQPRSWLDLPEEAEAAEGEEGEEAEGEGGEGRARPARARCVVRGGQ